MFPFFPFFPPMFPFFPFFPPMFPFFPFFPPMFPFFPPFFIISIDPRELDAQQNGEIEEEPKDNPDE
jgi:hypothetical protein